MMLCRTSDKPNHTKRRLMSFCILAIIQFTLSGCADPLDDPIIKAHQENMKILHKRSAIYMDFQANPDTNTWREQRQKMAQTLGQRDYDVNFPRAFDSLVLAVGSLELDVQNMERQSGYITAGGWILPPAEIRVVRTEMLRQWVTENGFNLAVLGDHYSYMPSRLDPEPSLTLQLVKLGDNRTRVKANFSNVLFPDEMRRYYERVWQAVDKQLFVSKNTNTCASCGTKNFLQPLNHLEII